MVTNQENICPKVGSYKPETVEQHIKDSKWISEYGYEEHQALLATGKGWNLHFECFSEKKIAT